MSYNLTSRLSYIVVTLAVLTICSIAHFPQTVTAFECDTSPDPWYNTSLTIDLETLPNNVIVVQQDDLRLLRNVGDKPLYIIEEAPEITQPWEDTVFDDPGIPLGYRPLYKLQRGEIYGWGYTRANKVGWQLYDGVEGVIINSLLYTSTEPSAQVFADNRPDPTLLDLPSPQLVTILVYHGDGIQEISGSVLYTLNNNYSPTAGAEAQRHCSIAQDQWLQDLNNGQTKSWWDKLWAILNSLF